VSEISSQSSDPASRPVRVLVADDHPSMGAAIAGILSTECQVVGRAKGVLQLMNQVERLHPEIVILDIGMPHLEGFEAARSLRALHPQLRIIFVSVHDDPDYFQAAFEAGGSGYVVKSRLASDLLPAVRSRSPFFPVPQVVTQPPTQTPMHQTTS